MMDKTVSIVVPVYNVERYLARCIESLVEQTYTDLEIILVDDGSTDASPKICDDHASKDDRIKVIHKENDGLSAARNTGIKIATGGYMMFIDSDDWIDLDTIDVLVDRAISTGCDIVAHSLYKNKCGKDQLVLPTKGEEYEIDVERYRIFLYASCMLNQSGFSHLYPEQLRCGPEMSYPVLKLFRRSFIQENDLFFPEDLRFCEDKVFELNVVRAATKIYYINRPFYHYLIRPGSLTNRHAREKSKDYLTTFCYLERSIKALDEFDGLERYFDLNVLSACWNITERYGMEVSDLKGIWDASKGLKCFLDDGYCKKAVDQADHTLVRGIKHILLTMLLKCRAYKTAIFVCYIYYKIDPKKNVLKESRVPER